jgi:gmma-aminobutyric acid receptor subunit gamma/cGMP-dependent protein kinase 2
MLFIDDSSLFNTIVPSKLINKLRTLGLNISLCNWILDFLMGRPPLVRVGNNTSATLILNMGAPHGYVLSPLLYSLFTHDCTARHESNTIIKFADDTTVVGLITVNNETAYREEVRDLVVWCQDNNLSLNVIKTKEMIVDYRKKRTKHAPHSHRQRFSGAG